MYRRIGATPSHESTRCGRRLIVVGGKVVAISGRATTSRRMSWAHRSDVIAAVVGEPPLASTPLR
jgi:hypothetical protein